MDKIFLQKLSNMSDLASDMNKLNNHFIVDVECKNHTVKDLNTFAHRIKQISNNVNDATKFFLTNNVRDFVADNFVDICKMDKMKQEFRLPTDKPLLIQSSDLNRTILINEIDGFAYADYQVDFFTNYKDSKQILINPFMSFVFSKNFFIELLDKFPKEIYLNFQKQDYADLVETTKEWRENRMGQIFQLLLIYFSVINLSNDLDIFEEKKVNGLKKQPYQNFSLASFISKPVYEHITLDINVNNKKYINNGNSSQSKKRLHGVRGHLRQLQNGKIVWVNPYKRGDSRLGVITKDYKLDFKRRAIS
tara:strand:+ start:40 stop:957 length:918 start_codon:yes stop_codon:yes gene_type:complete